MDLKDRHLFITGAARRVARVMAETFLTVPGADGLRLSAHFHKSRKEMETLVSFAKAQGQKLHPVSADLKHVVEIKKAVEAAVKHFGPVDILINSAGDFYPTSALTTSEPQWDNLLDLNLKGPFFLAQLCAKEMISRGGVILNIADVNGFRPIKNFAAYSASKAGLLMITKSLAKEWAPSIQVNAISPGAVLPPENYTEEERERSIAKALLKRWGTPQDIAQAAHFLIANDYITGFNLMVDGGRSLT